MQEYFNFTFRDRDLQKNFIRVMNQIGRTVFSNADRAKVIYNISHSSAVSVVNDTGTYRLILKQIENYATITDVKKGYNPSHFLKSIFTILTMSNDSFPRLMYLLKEFNSNVVYYNEQFNVVWYTEYYTNATRVNVR